MKPTVRSQSLSSAGGGRLARIVIVTISALLLFASPGMAVVVPFGPERVITATAFGNPSSVHAADVDGDGDVDVLSADQYFDTIAWHENDGASPPSFTEHVITTAAEFAVSVHAADVDGDGDMDVLSAAAHADTVVWYESNGASPPSFTEHLIATADGANSVYAADVDGDGDMDVLSASGADHTVAWYENNGGSPPGFTRRVITTAADGARSVHAVDVDGDGDMDVLSASAGDGTVAWYRNDGASPPGFTRRVITTAAASAWSVHAADVDGDGDVDVLSASPGDDTVAWYENDGTRRPAFTRRVITRGVEDAFSIHAADVDGDGDVDVLATSRFDGKVAWYENDGTRRPAFSRRAITTAAEGAVSVHAADVDGDGDMDVLSASEFDDTVAWYENRSPHPDLTFRGRRIAAAADGAISVHAADVDGDGDTDVLSASHYGDAVAWYENDGARRPAFRRRGITAAAYGAASVRAADMDGDGDVDVLSASYDGDTVSWYENDGASPPSFTWRIITNLADGAWSVDAADMDGDGNMDVLSASWDDDTLAWYESDGASPPGFTERVITSLEDGAVSVDAADVDGDGDVDVLFASKFDHTVAWYESDGAPMPAFTRRVVTATATGVQSIHAADVDGDGDVDVLSAWDYGGTIAWHESDGASPPGFTERVITASATGAYSVQAADVDGDGDVDVLSASWVDDTVAWYENDGSRPPAFTPRVIATAADEARSVYAADVDGDGDVDVLSASSADDSIRWYENRPDVAVIRPVDGDTVDCGSPGVRSTRPLIRWDPGPYDRFRVQISWDPAFSRMERITSGRELLKKKFWRPGAKAWRRACNNAAPYLYIRVFGRDLNIRRTSPIRNVMSDPAQVEPEY